MSHRLLEKYPSLYQLCRFDLSTLKEQLSQFTSEDISVCTERAIIDRMDAAYQSLSDESIMTLKSLSSKLCHVNQAAFISLPCGFDCCDGTLKLYMKRTFAAVRSGDVFQFYGFGTTILPNTSGVTAHTTPQRLNDAQVIKSKRITPNYQLSGRSQQIETLQHDVAESRMRTALAIHELHVLHEKLSQPITETEKRSLFARLKQNILRFLGL